MIDPFQLPWVRAKWRGRVEVVESPPFAEWTGIELQGPCWLFTGKWDNGDGHKKVRIKSQPTFVHRYAYMQYYGVELASDQHVDHLCRRRNCFQPLHLEVVTLLQNLLRGNGLLTQFGAPDPDDWQPDLPQLPPLLDLFDEVPF